MFSASAAHSPARWLSAAPLHRCSRNFGPNGDIHRTNSPALYSNAILIDISVPVAAPAAAVSAAHRLPAHEYVPAFAAGFPDKPSTADFGGIAVPVLLLQAGCCWQSLAHTGLSVPLTGSVPAPEPAKSAAMLPNAALHRRLAEPASANAAEQLPVEYDPDC